MGKSLAQIIIFFAASVALQTHAHGDKGGTHERYAGRYEHQQYDAIYSVQRERERLNREREQMHRAFDARMRELDHRGREIDRWQSSLRHNHQQVARRANEKRAHLNRERDQLNRQREQMNQEFDQRLRQLDRRQQYAHQHHRRGDQWREQEIYLWADGTCYQKTQSGGQQVLMRAPKSRCY